MRLTWFAVATATLVTFSPRSLAQEAQNLGFELGEVGKTPADWKVHTQGWNAELSEEHAARGTRSAKLFLPGESTAPFGGLMRTMPGAEFAGKHVTLTSKILVVGEGRGQMWLRVDRTDGSNGTFDNMHDRPIFGDEWGDATIEADIEPDAATLNFGFISNGGATLFIDDVTMKVSAGIAAQEASPPRALSSRALENVTAAAKLLSYVRFFHPSDQAVGVASWDHFAVDLMERAEPASDADDLVKRLTEAFIPITFDVEIWAGAPEQATTQRPSPAGTKEVAMWRHFGAGKIAPARPHGAYHSVVERTPLDAPSICSGGSDAMVVVKSLGGGVSCRIPIAVWADEQGTLPRGTTPAAWGPTTVRAKLVALNRSTRLAGVALAWGVFQHFYPYFDVVKTDWIAALPVALSKAAVDADESAYLSTLREMVAKLHDGHGYVSGPSFQGKPALPIAVEWAGKDLVVVGKYDGVSSDLSLGDVIVSIDGRPIEDCYNTVAKQISAATDGFCRFESEEALRYDLETKDPAHVVVRKPDASTASVDLTRMKFTAPNTAMPKRPANGSELMPGIVYFDLDHAERAELEKVMSQLTAAKAIVFDMRGYPGSAGYELMQHLIDGPATSARWCVPIVTRPDHEGFEWNEDGRWPLVPKAPRLTAKIAFLTDGRAISYAESIMGIVEAYKLGAIIGSTTAGTNGNVNPFKLPGGYSVSWTGMKVLKHDGSQHHGVGIAPTIPVTPTAKGLAEGRDEVLERAVEVMQARMAAVSQVPK